MTEDAEINQQGNYMDTPSNFSKYTKKACSKIRPINLLLSKGVKDFWIAGGFLRSLYNSLQSHKSKPLTDTIVHDLSGCNDLDIYFKNRKDITKAKQILKEDGYFNECDRTHFCSFAGPDGKFDLVKIIYKDMKDCLSHFDFDIVACAYHPGLDKLCYQDTFFESNKNRHLSINSIENPIRIINRLKKYVGRRKYKISTGDLIKAFTKIIFEIPKIKNLQTLSKYISAYARPIEMSTEQYNKIRNQIKENYEKNLEVD